jgi:hypothetical protein
VRAAVAIRAEVMMQEADEGESGDEEGNTAMESVDASF